MDTLKLAAKEQPLTPEMISEGLVRIGDYITPRANLRNSYQDKIGFIEGKYYDIKRIENDGLVLNSETGFHHIHFNSDDGGAQHFNIVELSTDEMLGTLGTIPRDILILLSNHNQARRNSLISELSVKYGINEKGKKDLLKSDVNKALSLLLEEGYIEGGSSVGSFVITITGRQSLRS